MVYAQYHRITEKPMTRSSHGFIKIMLELIFETDVYQKKGRETF